MRDALAPADLAGPWSVDALLFPHLAKVVSGQPVPAPTPKAAALPLTDYLPNPVREGKRIAVLNVGGFLTKGRSYFGTSTVQLRQELKQAAADPTVSGILLAVESPGGTVAGTAELAAEVQAAKRKKPVWAQVQDLAASAGYWIAASADQVWANQPTALVGSVGTILTVVDVSAAMEKDGVKVNTITTGELKPAGVFGTPFTDAQRAMLQAVVDDTQAQFDAALVSGRGLSAEQLKEVKGGGIYTASRAKSLKLVDGIRTPDKTLAALAAAR